MKINGADKLSTNSITISIQKSSLDWLLITTLIILLLSSLNITGQINYLSQINETNFTSFVHRHQMIVKDNYLYVVNERGTATSSADNEIILLISSNYGNNWIEKNITIESKQTEIPMILEVFNSIIILYGYEDTNSEDKVCVVKTTNYGDSFSYSSIDDDQLEDVIGYIGAFGEAYDIAVNGSEIILGNNDFLFYSNDLANSFVNITPDNIKPSFENVRLSYDGNTLWATYNSNDSIFVYQSSDKGSNFQKIYSFDGIVEPAIETIDINGELNLYWTELSVGYYYIKYATLIGSALLKHGSIDFSTYYSYRGINVTKDNFNNIWLAASGAASTYHVYFSQDDGFSWSRGANLAANLWSPPVYFSNLKCTNSDNIYFIADYGYSSLHTYELVNAKWTSAPISQNLPVDTTIANWNIYINWDPYVVTNTYRVQISDKEYFSSSIIDTITEDSYIYIDLFDVGSWFEEEKKGLDANNSLYYYRVRGQDNSYSTEWSPTKTFRFGSLITDTPQIIAPSNNSSFTYPNNVDFQWNPLPGITDYEIHLSSSSSFTDTLINPWRFTFNSTSTSFPIYYNGELYFRIRGIEYWTGSVGPWSSALKFNYTGIPSDVGSENELPQKYEIYQNYPNPFNPSTLIKFSIPELSNVNVSVYNALGEFILNLEDKEFATGHHETKWNAENQPSGIYFIKIEAESTMSDKHYSNTIKAILLK